MADENSPKQRFNFEPVDEEFKVAGGARRDAASCDLAHSGRAEFNAEGAELVSILVGAMKLDPNNVAMKFHADETAKMVAGYIVKPGTTGAMPIGRGADLTTHMGNVFRKHPRLRPSSEQEVRVSLVLDETPPYMLFNLQTAGPKVRRQGTGADAGQAGTEPGATATKKKSRAKGKQTTTPPAETNAAAGSDENKNPQ